MSKTTYEEYLKRYGTLIYKNTGTSMLPLLKQGRDAFIVRAVGIPSTLWGFLPSFNRKRKNEGLSYFSFFTEKWANYLGEQVTGEKSMENLVID